MDLHKKEIEITWNATYFVVNSGHESQLMGLCERVNKIVYLQSIANQLSNAFTDIKKVESSIHLMQICLIHVYTGSKFLGTH